jgi:ABC-2 type transport system permease protein
MEHEQQLIWEYGNYALAFTLLMALALVDRQRRKRKQREYLTWISQ